MSVSFIVSEGVPHHMTILRQPVYQGAGLAMLTGPCLHIHDVMGHVIPSFNQAVEAAAEADSKSISKPPTLEGRSVALAESGRVVFTDLMLANDVMGANYSLVFTLKDHRHVSIRSSSFTSSLGPASRLVLVNQPSSSTESLKPFSRQPALQLLDIGGNLLADPDGVQVHLLPAAVAVEGEEPILNNGAAAAFEDHASEGGPLASFVGLNIDRAGRYAMRFSCCNGLSVTSSEFFITVGQPYRLKLAVQAASTVFGVVISPSPQVRLADLAGNWAGSAHFEASVSLVPGSTKDAPLGGSGELLSFHNTKQTVQSQRGMAVFSGLAIDHAGHGYTLVFRSQGLVPVVSEPFNVSGPVGQLQTEWNPVREDADATMLRGGWLNQPRVHLLDRNGIPVTCLCSSGTVRARAQQGDSIVEVTGNSFAHAAEGTGYAQFTDLGLSYSGSGYQLLFEFTPYGAGDPVSGVSQVFEVIPGRPSTLRVYTQMDAHWRGVAPGQQPMLGLLDGYGNRITVVTGTVSAAIIKDQELIGELKGNRIAEYREDGYAHFTDLSIVPRVQEYDAFKLTFNSKGLLSTSAGIVIVSGPLYSVELEQPVIGSVSNLQGGLLYPPVTIITRDIGGGVVYGFDRSGCNGLECRISVRITKGPGCCDFCHVKCEDHPLGSMALTGATDLLADRGMAVFTDLRIKAVGSYDLVFQTSSFGGRVPIKVPAADLQVAPAQVLAVVTQPARVATGVVFRRQPVVKIMTSSSETVLAARHRVTAQIAASSTCTGLRSATQNRSSASPSLIVHVDAVDGIAIFTDLSIDSAPSTICKLAFTMSIGNNASEPFISVDSAEFPVVESMPALHVLTQPASGIGGAPFSVQPSLILKDRGGNIMVSDDTVKAVGLDKQGREVPLIGGLEVPTYNGIANFTNLGAAKSQTAFTLLFQCGNVWSKSGAFDVVPSNVSRLSILVQPTETSTSVAISPTVALQALDSGGNVPLMSFAVTGQLVPATLVGCCSGCVGSVDGRGRVTFPDLKITCKGRSMRIKFTAESHSVISDPFDVHGEPVSVEMHDFPRVRSEVAGKVLLDAPAVMLFDDAALRTTTIDKNVSVSLKKPGRDGSYAAMPWAALRGITTVESLYGVATFSDLSITTASQGLVLVFTLGAAQVISEQFTITHGPAVHMNITQQPKFEQFTGIPVLPFPKVVLYDIFGNLASTSSDLVRACIAGDDIAGCGGEAEVVGAGTPDVLPMSAVATFEQIKLFWRRNDAGAGSRASLRFYLSNRPNATAVSNPFALYLNTPQIVISTQPSLARAGAAMRVPPVVEIRDAGGYTFTQLRGGISYLELNVSLALSSSPSAQLSLQGRVCPCLVRLEQGVARMKGLAIDTPGTFYSLLVSLPAMGIASVSSTQFSVCGPASTADISLQPPSRVPYGQSFELVLRIRDPNQVPVDTEAVNASVQLADASTCLEPEPPILSGQLTLAALGGEAHFTDLAIDRAYACMLRVCFQLDPGATSIHHLLTPSLCTIDFSVTHGAPHHLSLLSPIPTLTSADLLLPRPQVFVVDQVRHNDTMHLRRVVMRARVRVCGVLCILFVAAYLILCCPNYPGWKHCVGLHGIHQSTSVR